jgi:hypothetical protein
LDTHENGQTGRRRRFLTAFDYGMGAVYEYVLADSAEDIVKRFAPDATVLTTPPPWLAVSDLVTLPVEDIDDETGFLGSLFEELEKSREDSRSRD